MDKNTMQSIPSVLAAAMACVLAACGTAGGQYSAVAVPPPPTTQASASSASPSAAAILPSIPAPVPVTLDARTTALLILDFTSVNCQPDPVCLGTITAVTSLRNKARAAKVPVIYSTISLPAGPPPFLADLAPQPGEPVVSARANKFTDTDLEAILKQRNIRTLVIVGNAANGAVMYTSLHANTKGYTVVVAEDGISSPVPINTHLARYQLLNQPGFANADNTPLADKKVTLSRSDLITFR